MRRFSSPTRGIEVQIHHSMAVDCRGEAWPAIKDQGSSEGGIWRPVSDLVVVGVGRMAGRQRGLASSALQGQSTVHLQIVTCLVTSRVGHYYRCIY